MSDRISSDAVQFWVMKYHLELYRLLKHYVEVFQLVTRSIESQRHWIAFKDTAKVYFIKKKHISVRISDETTTMQVYNISSILISKALIPTNFSLVHDKNITDSHESLDTFSPPLDLPCIVGTCFSYHTWVHA